MGKETILDKAKRITGKDRMEEYCHPKENFQLVADFWNVFLVKRFKQRLKSGKKIKIKDKDVALMMDLFKSARVIITNYKHLDSLVDKAGYTRNIEQILEVE